MEERHKDCVCDACLEDARIYWERKAMTTPDPTVSLDEVEGVLLDCAKALTEAANILTGVGYPSSGKTMTGYAEKATATATRIKERR